MGGTLVVPFISSCCISFYNEPKLERFLSMDCNKWVNMGMKSREKVERQFDRNIVVDAYLEAIEEILSKKGWNPSAK